MDEQQVMKLVSDTLGIQPQAASHMAFGHNSVTYDVALSSSNIIVRTNKNAQVFSDTEHNLTVLAQLGLPVPRVLATDLTLKKYSSAYMILDKIPGRDLRYELEGMTRGQMTKVAEQIVSFQHTVATLPMGKGFGYVAIGEQGPFSSWLELLQFELQRRSSDVQKDILDKWRIRLTHVLDNFKVYLAQVQSVCFLDDVTIKNVILLNGELQGLVDFDCVCYGDPLWMIGLTKTAIVSDIGVQALFYVEELCRIWQLIEEQHNIVDLYAAIHTLDFMERLMTKESNVWVERTMEIVETWLAHLESM